MCLVWPEEERVVKILKMSHLDIVSYGAPDMTWGVEISLLLKSSMMGERF